MQMDYDAENTIAIFSEDRSYIIKFVCLNDGLFCQH